MAQGAGVWSSFDAGIAKKDLITKKKDNEDYLEVFKLLMSENANQDFVSPAKIVAASCLEIYTSLQLMKGRKERLHSLCLIIRIHQLYKNNFIEKLQRELTSLSSLEPIEFPNAFESIKEIEKELQFLSGEWGIPSSPSLDKINQNKDLTFAKTKQEYIFNLKNYFQQNQDLLVFPLTTTSKKIVSSFGILGSLVEISSQEEYQDGKDIQRDQVLFNNVSYKGSLGYEKIILSMAMQLEELAKIHLTKEIDQTIWISYAKLILQACNRTQSGGASYETLECFFGNKNLLFLKPLTNQASPLKICVDIGPYYSPSSLAPSLSSPPSPSSISQGSLTQSSSSSLCPWHWGLRASLQASTSYGIYDSENPDDADGCWGILKTCYRNRIAISLGMSPNSQEGGNRCARYDQGEILVELSSMNS